MMTSPPSLAGALFRTYCYFGALCGAAVFAAFTYARNALSLLRGADRPERPAATTWWDTLRVAALLVGPPLCAAAALRACWDLIFAFLRTEQLASGCADPTAAGGAAGPAAWGAILRGLLLCDSPAWRSTTESVFIGAFAPRPPPCGPRRRAKLQPCPPKPHS